LQPANDIPQFMWPVIVNTFPIPDLAVWAKAKTKKNFFSLQAFQKNNYHTLETDYLINENFQI